MENTEKIFTAKEEDETLMICMKQEVPCGAKEVEIVLHTFEFPICDKEVTNAFCELLNSQAALIKSLRDENLELKRKVIELCRKIKPFGGPNGDG